MACLKIMHPPGYEPERTYVYEVLLKEFLGLDYVLDVHHSTETVIQLVGDTQPKAVILPDVLFQTPAEKWLTSESLPEVPLQRWRLPDSYAGTRCLDPSLPMIYGRAAWQRDSETTRNEISLNLDVFGSAFFMLTRYEELAARQVDDHDRFPATASLAYQNGFLLRPIVNEYLEVLWETLKKLWPALRRKPRKARIILSHDVDYALCVAGRPFWSVLKSAAADLLLRQDWGLGIRRLRSYQDAKRGIFDTDPCNTFDYIMEQSERHGLNSAFYFMMHHEAGKLDGGIHSPDHPWVRRLMKRIHSRGHEIGIHTSYNSYLDAGGIKKEAEKLLRVAEEEDIQQAAWGGRQHYLRWRNPDTWQYWQDAGLSYDSTLTFADHVGFRCGACYEYPVFNLFTRSPLSLRERPLIAMETTLISYMGNSLENSVQKIVDLKAICDLFQGEFTLLWHNTNLMSENHQHWYKNLWRHL